VTARPRPNRLDLLLLALGAAGLALFLFALPREHPDAAATFGDGPEAAIERARTFLEDHGYTSEGRTASAYLVRDRALLDSLQRQLGRRATIQALREGERERLPAHHWLVRWADGEEEALVVRLTQGGAVWSFTNSAVVPQTEGGAGAGGVDPVAAARRHLGATALAALPMGLEGVDPLPARAASRVRFASAEPVLGQHVTAEVDVSAGGDLLALGTQVGVSEGVSVRTGNVVLGAGGTAGAVKWIGFALLALALLAVVLRRLTARALDARAAIKDAALAGALAAVGLALSLPLFIAQAALTEALMIVAIGAGFSAAGIGVATFVASAGADALARERDPDPVRSLALARQGAWANAPVGRALLRGSFLASALLGLGALALVALPGAQLASLSSNPYLDSQVTLSLVVSGLASSLWKALLTVQAVLVAIGAWVRRWRPAAALLALTVAAAVLFVEFVRFPSGSGAIRWGALLVVGFALAAAYRRTDALTIVVALTLAGVVWGAVEGLVVPGSPARLDFFLALGLLAAVGAAGGGAVWTGRGADELPDYEPDFVAEQRERARLQRELEIAREVQRSFLPLHVPDVAGVALAARCVPAEEVGGDYYDLFALDPRRLGVVIGDVSGKGIQAAFFMTLMKGALLAMASEGARPAAVLTRLNALFTASAPRGTFASMIYGVLDLDACTFTFGRAGHTPLLVRRAAGGVETLRPAGLAIGIAPEAVFAATLCETVVELCPGDTLALYTDGVSEAMDRRRRLYSDERLAEAVASAPPEADALLDAVMADVNAHAEGTGLDDDLTMVALHVLAPRCAPSGDGAAG
jgi:phosphoserine phosphatase RsbU/P